MKPRYAFLLIALAACAGHRPDPREGLKGGLTDAGQAISGLKISATVPSPKDYLSAGPIDFSRINSDLTFTGQYAIQGNFNGFQIWDMSKPTTPTIVATYQCPASQNDVSVFRNLLFMSSEGNDSHMDCSVGPIRDTVSRERVRGIRIFDISNIRQPKLMATVQTCRGSHTHTVVEDPKDRENVYIYVSGSAGLRSPTELAGCTTVDPSLDPTSALWRIEIIKVPLANPASASVISRADIFSGLKVVTAHAPAELDIQIATRIADSVKKAGGMTAINLLGNEVAMSGFFIRARVDSIAKARGAKDSTQYTAADTAIVRANIQTMYTNALRATAQVNGQPIATNRQCHDITVYPSVGLAGGACEGHGILLDISDVTRPRRLDAAADSNFAYWHSATFNNDGTKLLFSDEWGGGTSPKCRATDKKEWGSDAIFDIKDRKLVFGSYYKIAAAQTANENCVAHNGSLIPIPGRDVMVQAWYQGGISVFDFTDTKKPVEIAYFDRGPIDSTRLTLGGSWSAYWYNGQLVSSEIARGLDAFEMVPTEFVTQNEIDAANTVKLPYLNAQGQPKFNWPPSFPLAKAYTDQLERKKCLPKARIAEIRGEIAMAETAPAAGRVSVLQGLAASLSADAQKSCDAPKVKMLQQALTDLSRPLVP